MKIDFLHKRNGLLELITVMRSCWSVVSTMDFVPSVQGNRPCANVEGELDSGPEASLS